MIRRYFKKIPELTFEEFFFMKQIKKLDLDFINYFISTKFSSLIYYIKNYRAEISYRFIFKELLKCFKNW